MNIIKTIKPGTFYLNEYLDTNLVLFKHYFLMIRI